MNEQPNGGWTLEDARKWLREERAEGVRCPCCYQFAKIYKRALNAGIARAIITMYQAGSTGWVHKPTVLSGLGAAARDESIARYWGLLEEELEVRRDDGGRAGWWRVTPKGEQWIHGQILVPKYAYIYDSQLLEVNGPPTSIRTALGTKFDYEELMGSLIQPRTTLFDL